MNPRERIAQLLAGIGSLGSLGALIGIGGGPADEPSGGGFKSSAEYQRELTDVIGKWDILQTAAERETADA